MGPSHSCDGNHRANRKVLKIRNLVGNEIVGFSEITEVATAFCGGLRIDRTAASCFSGGLQSLKRCVLIFNDLIFESKVDR